MKNKRWLNIEKKIIKRDKMPYCNYKELLSFRKIVFFSRLGWHK